MPVERSQDLKLGQTVQIISDNDKVVAESHIDFISPEVDNSTQSILAKATFDNKSGALRTSQFAQARIIWSVRQGLVISVLAVTRINGQFFAFVAQRNGNMTVAHQQILQVGDMIGSVYSVLGGLKAATTSSWKAPKSSATACPFPKRLQLPSQIQTHNNRTPSS